MNHFTYCLLFVAFTVFLLPAGAQTEFSTPAGDLIHCGSDTEIEIENPLSQNKKIT
ncbi:hypothetical protein GF373_09950, partial [bacterium]|nr:hypothetical protein [bacterium]